MTKRLKSKSIVKQSVPERRLSDLSGIGTAMLQDFKQLGIRTVEQLAKKDGKDLYDRLCCITRTKQDPCVLDTFNCAVAQARDPNLPKSKKNWWWWSQQRKSKSNTDLDRIVQHLKTLIRTICPDAKQFTNPWGIPTFESNGPFCYYAIANKHVTFGFLLGTSLNDPKGLLEGTGKNLRHIKLRQIEDLDQPGLKTLIKEAVKLNARSAIQKRKKS